MVLSKEHTSVLKRIHIMGRFLLALSFTSVVAAAPQAQMAQSQAAPIPMGATPAVGAKAPAFSLRNVKGESVSLAGELARGPVVLVVGRGWPGYQCPFCTRQFGDFRAHAAEIQQAGARVLWVYPGPAEGLSAHAADFAGADIPANFQVLTDPAYVFTLAYGLRWDAPGETAYPSTFVIDRAGVVRMVAISKEHGGRTPAADVIKTLQMLGK
jgi:peroxiredoxin